MNSQPPHGSAADQQIHNIGTTARFIQMIVLMLLASWAMTASLMSTVDDDSMGCLLAAGANLDEPTVNGIALATASQPDAYKDCLDEYTSTPPAWIGPLGVLLTAAAALVLFLAIPKWRTRRGRVVVLSEQDQVIRAQVLELSERAGLSKTPTIVIDLVEPRISAVSFGRNGNPVIRINGAAIRERESQPNVFEALLLHEFAHVRNRDITLTYASVALWRVFVLFAVIPYLVFEILDLPNAAAGFASETAVQLNLASQGLAVILVGMTYLARLEVLRRREYDADQAAIGWQADPRALEKLADHTSKYRVIRWLSRGLSLWC